MKIMIVLTIVKHHYLGIMMFENLTSTLVGHLCITHRGRFSGESILDNIEYVGNCGREPSRLGVPFEGYLHGIQLRIPVSS